MKKKRKRQLRNFEKGIGFRILAIVIGCLALTACYGIILLLKKVADGVFYFGQFIENLIKNDPLLYFFGVIVGICIAIAIYKFIRKKL